tara:strand:+ start:107 stop:457 length:351 start_codon:yes stop_codon:yes gene_type:complete
MKHSAIFIFLIANLAGCASGLPSHSEFQVVTTQREMSRLFGDPKSIDKFSNSPDVAHAADLARSGLRVMHYERWTYPSIDRTDSSKIGHTIITFRMSTDGLSGFTEGMSWISGNEN